MKLQDFFKRTHKIERLNGGYEFQEIRPRIVCKDGVSLSVQGSHTHYCSPRENYPMYSSVEVGYPSIRPPSEWGQYFDGTWQDLSISGKAKQFFEALKNAWYSYKHFSVSHAKSRLMSAFKDNATDSVYGYVPFELVEDFINQHGGIDEDKTFTKK